MRDCENIQNVKESLEINFEGFKIECFVDAPSMENTFILSLSEKIERQEMLTDPVASMSKLYDLFSKKLFKVPVVSNLISAKNDSIKELKDFLVDANRIIEDLKRYKTYYNLHREMLHGPD